MYASLPLSCPVRVVDSLLVARATPKSESRALPSTPTSTFCGEMSRCTMPNGLAVVVLQLVRRVEPREHVDDDAQADLRRQAHAALRRAREEAPEGVALHVLHDDVVALLALADLEDGHDVRVVDARREARLLEEHLDELGLAREVRVQPLDGDEALEAADAREAREIHRRHPAGRQLGDQLEPIEPSALSFDGDQLAQVTPLADGVMLPIMTPARLKRPS